ncbi:hypothetical protein [Synechococcus sp. M16CYN]|uniref:hypothetical protein n=1 Tax=Synechococcus sp. M16CYN TaxID=3103139 RepID=UPI00333F10F8
MTSSGCEAGMPEDKRHEAVAADNGGSVMFQIKERGIRRKAATPRLKEILRGILQ